MGDAYSYSFDGLFLFQLWHDGWIQVFSRCIHPHVFLKVSSTCNLLQRLYFLGIAFKTSVLVCTYEGKTPSRERKKKSDRSDIALCLVYTEQQSATQVIRNKKIMLLQTLLNYLSRF